jgi:hypothetical protein
MITYSLGGGRHVTDPAMERSLLEWYKVQINKQIEITSKNIKAKARELSKNQDFKASKGWLEKFRKKHQITLKRAKRTPKKINKEEI